LHICLEIVGVVVYHMKIPIWCRSEFYTLPFGRSISLTCPTVCNTGFPIHQLGSSLFFFYFLFENCYQISFNSYITKRSAVHFERDSKHMDRELAGLSPPIYPPYNKVDRPFIPKTVLYDRLVNNKKKKKLISFFLLF
jgi:hypothetical protein